MFYICLNMFQQKASLKTSKRRGESSRVWHRCQNSTPASSGTSPFLIYQLYLERVGNQTEKHSIKIVFVTMLPMSETRIGNQSVLFLKTKQNFKEIIIAVVVVVSSKLV